jgi:hypothetical protein
LILALPVVFDKVDYRMTCTPCFRMPPRSSRIGPDAVTVARRDSLAPIG